MLKHEIRAIAIDPGFCQSVTRTGCARTAERIDVLFRIKTKGSQETLLDDAAPILYGEGIDTA